MAAAPITDNEEERLHWLRRIGILDTLEEQAYDDLAFLAAQICGTPIALVSLVDRDRQWFKSHIGLDVRETSRDMAFCAHAIHADRPLVVEDAESDARFCDNPLVLGDPRIRFYAGAPLILRDNIRLGTLCVIDHQSHQLTEDQIKSLEALARQTTSQLELRLQMDELKRLDDAKDEFIAVVSHEMRTPLTSMKGALGLLSQQMKGVLDEQVQGLADIAFRNTERLLILVNDVLDMAKLQAGKLELDRGPVDVRVLIERSEALNRHYAETCGCSVQLLMPAGDPLEVSGDEPRLLQVLSNLLSNAAKFTRKNDVIELQAERCDGFVRIGVTDHGPGVPAERRSQLFQRFATLSRSGDAKLPGTGLGLAICKELVELHGGEIGFETLPGERTTFFFTLPLLPSRAS